MDKQRPMLSLYLSTTVKFSLPSVRRKTDWEFFKCIHILLMLNGFYTNANSFLSRINQLIFSQARKMKLSFLQKKKSAILWN